MTSIYGQLVVGPPGSGKTAFCHTMGQFLKSIGRKVAIINIDPANDSLIYEAAVDISQLVCLEDVMDNLKLGPNGGLTYCMEFLETNIDWLLKEVSKFKDHYFLIDCPGQIELYTHHNSLKNIVSKLGENGFHLCTVHLVDSHYCSDPEKFISALLMTLSSMLQMALPHINILSKVDLMIKHKDQLRFNVDYYADVLDLSHLLDSLNKDSYTNKFTKLNEALVSLVEDYGLVTFLPLNIKDKLSLVRVKNAVDKANGYIYGSGEERNIQSLLACAVGAEYEHEKTGDLMDKLMVDGNDEIKSQFDS